MKVITRERAFSPKNIEEQRRIFLVKEGDLPNLPYSFSVYVEITEEEESSGVKFPDIVEFVKNSGVGIPKPKDILEERQGTHGDFAWVAEISQELKDCFRQKADWYNLTNVQREALDNIAQKTARIFSGNPNFADHWVDIQGYAKLAEKEIRKGENQDGPTSPK
jgi:hypothetical protein